MGTRRSTRPACRQSRRTRALHGAAASCLCGFAATADAQAQEAAPAPTAAASTPTYQLPTVHVPGKRPIDIGPLPGLAISKDQIPANIQSATKEEIKASKALNLGDYLNSQLQGVSINDYSGNPFQMDVNYRGFTASPQVGTPQGLSVFFDGVRVNEPFGDVVNWDLIPLNAIERFDLFPGSNPLFGLNTLGGAISVRTKSGFTAPGIEAEVLAGSWARKQVQVSGGGRLDDLAGFAALTYFDENGWRDDSPSRVWQFYGRGDWAQPDTAVKVSLLAADNRLIGNGLIPIELWRDRAKSVFTSPDKSKNTLWQATLAADHDLSDALNVGLRAYHRRNDRAGLNGDIYEDFEDLYSSAGRNGALVPGGQGAGVVGGTPIGLLTDTTLEQKTDGIALQANWNLTDHKFMVGASIDRSRAAYRMSQRLGLIDASHRVYVAPTTDANPQPVGTIQDFYYAAGHDVFGNAFDGKETTKSLYASETWSAKPNLHITAAARANWTTTDSKITQRGSSAQVELDELHTGTPGLPGYIESNVTEQEGFYFRSFNPQLGVNWLPDPDLNLYGNLSRGARVPSVVELGCAFDDTPVDISVGNVKLTQPRSLTGPGCSLPTTLSGDPYLPQIRSTSGELGGRGRLAGNWSWNASVYRTDLKDDIYYVGVGSGRSYFDTIGKTRRQGFELGLSGSAGPFDLKLGYSYTRATFESTFYEVSPHNSSADFDQNSQAAANNGELFGQNGAPTPTASANKGRGTYLTTRIDPGAKLPGIPIHALSGHLDWHATEALKLRLGTIVRSSSYVRGNENNAHRPGANTDQQTGLYYCGSYQGGSCGSFGLEQLPVGPGRPFTDKGSVPGYAIFNLDGDYDFGGGLSAFVRITNLFDRKYFSAGRLGIDPFSPSVHGAIGPSGWNYNSSEWQNTTYVGPGSPRGIWVGLNYDWKP